LSQFQHRPNTWRIEYLADAPAIYSHLWTGLQLFVNTGLHGAYVDLELIQDLWDGSVVLFK
jgi:hypothetical protein